PPRDACLHGFAARLPAAGSCEQRLARPGVVDLGRERRPPGVVLDFEDQPAVVAEVVGAGRRVARTAVALARRDDTRLLVGEESLGNQRQEAFELSAFEEAPLAVV